MSPVADLWLLDIKSKMVNTKDHLDLSKYVVRSNKSMAPFAALQAAPAKEPYSPNYCLINFETFRGADIRSRSHSRILRVFLHLFLQESQSLTSKNLMSEGVFQSNVSRFVRHSKVGKLIQANKHSLKNLFDSRFASVLLHQWSRRHLPPSPLTSKLLRAARILLLYVLQSNVS